MSSVSTSTSSVFHSYVLVTSELTLQLPVKWIQTLAEASLSTKKFLISGIVDKGRGLINTLLDFTPMLFVFFIPFI